MKKNMFKKLSVTIGFLLCVIFSFLLMCNVMIIVKGTLYPEQPPSVFGVTPMVVLSGSMSGNAEDHIEVGDLIFDVEADLDSLKEGDIVSYMEQRIVVTHRIVDIYTDENGELMVITKGDANNVEDEPIHASQIIGLYKYRIPKLGDFAMFLQQPLGMVIFIGIPVCAFIISDVIRRNRWQKQKDFENEMLKAELEQLRATQKNDSSMK